MLSPNMRVLTYVHHRLHYVHASSGTCCKMHGTLKNCYTFFEEGARDMACQESGALRDTHSADQETATRKSNEKENGHKEEKTEEK